MDIVNPHAIRAITEDRLRIAAAARLAAATTPPRSDRRVGRSRRRGPRRWWPIVAGNRLAGA